MTAITLAECTVVELSVSTAVKVISIVTPSTADDGDTIDLSSLFSDWVVGVAYGATDKGLVCVNNPISTSITLPGSTDDEARSIIVQGQ